MLHSKRIVTALLALVLLVTALPAMAADGKVNVNTADEAQLALLPRVGPAVSSRIVEFRDENGPFTSPADLMLVRGIGEKTFELLESYIVLEGESTLTEKVRISRQSTDEKND